MLTVSFSNLHYFLASGSKDKTIKYKTIKYLRIFNMNLMSEICTLKGHTSKINIVEFSKND